MSAKSAPFSRDRCPLKSVCPGDPWGHSRGDPWSSAAVKLGRGGLVSHGIGSVDERRARESNRWCEDRRFKPTVTDKKNRMEGGLE